MGLDSLRLSVVADPLCSSTLILFACLDSLAFCLQETPLVLDNFPFFPRKSKDPAERKRTLCKLGAL